MKLEPPIPVLRIFDVALAKAFYVDWLGFALDWMHEQAPRAPRYLQVSRGAVILHLTEHYGDCSPGAKVFVHIDDVEALHRELSSRPNANMHPGIEDAPWNARVMTVIDPFGNRLCFNQNNPSGPPYHAHQAAKG